MVQHSLVIENDTGEAVRNDINDAFEALATHQSGSVEPQTPFANILWYDTNLHQLKIRNEANTAWIVIANIDQTNERAIPTTGAGRHRSRWAHSVAQAIPNPTATTMLFDTEVIDVTGGSWAYSGGEIAPPETGVYQIDFQGTCEATTTPIGTVTVTLEIYDGSNWAAVDGGQSLTLSALNQKGVLSLSSIFDFSSSNHAVRVRHVCDESGVHQWLSSQQTLTIIRLY